MIHLIAFLTSPLDALTSPLCIFLQIFVLFYPRNWDFRIENFKMSAVIDDLSNFTNYSFFFFKYCIFGENFLITLKFEF